jgi:uncharacterized membrane protein YoaK (UPF0700 family)
MTFSDAALVRLWGRLGNVMTGLILLGALGAVAGWRPSAWLLVGALTAVVAGHLAISAVAYRRTMRREWPRVEPLPDDDDW